MFNSEMIPQSKYTGISSVAQTLHVLEVLCGQGTDDTAIKSFKRSGFQRCSMLSGIFNYNR